MALLDGLARYLHTRGLVTFDETGTSGDCFLETLPPQPDVAISLTQYGGIESDSKLGYDEPRVQVRVRGGPDPRTSRDKAASIYGELHGLNSVTLPDGTYLVLCVGIQGGPTSIGRDENGRHEHVINIRCHIRAITTHRI